MNTIPKYQNIQDVLPKLQTVLREAIQSDFLEIQCVQRDCDKFSKACEEIKDLDKAYFVIYSRYIKKSDHRYEKFIFVDKEGQEVCDVSGQQMELYGLLSPCMSLELSKEYEASLVHPE
jgi:hypothetical protein